MTDNHYAYRAGDTFPRDGAKVSEERIRALLTGNNKRGVKLIEEVKDEEPKAEKPKVEKPKTEKATPKKTTSSTTKGRKK
jgi:hypothetical protein